MKRLLFGNVLVAAVLLTLAYFAVVNIVPPPVVITTLNGAAIGAAVLVSMIYAPLFWASTKKLESRVGILAIGMGCLFASFIGTRILSTVYRVIGRSDELVNHVLVGYLSLMGLVGIVLHVVAPGYPPTGFKEKFGGRYRWFIVLALGGGAFVAYVAATFEG